MSHKVILSLATNRFQAKNLCRARQCLAEVFADMRFTAELWTEPVGNSCRHDAYLNQLAQGTTLLDEEQLNSWLKQVEQSFGRTDQKRRLGIVPIDLDILEFDGIRRHHRDWERQYVKELITGGWSLP